MRLPLWPILLCALAVFFDGYEAQMLAMAVPLLAQHLRVMPTAFALASSASLAGMAFGALVLGPLSDRVGRKPLLILSLLLFGGGTLAALTIGSPGELAVWRLVAGCGLGAAVPITIAMVSEWAPPAHRVRVVTVMAMGFPVGASSAGLIAPLLTARWGWQGLFVYGGVAPLVIAALVAISVREPPRSLANEKPVWRRVGALFAPALRARTVLLCALNVVNLFANYGLASWLPTLLVQNGWTLAAASRATSVLAIGGLTGSFVASGLVDRGRIGLGLGGAYLVAAAGLALCATNPQSNAVWVVLLILIGCSMGTALTLGPLASAHYPADLRATGVGFANGVGRFGSLFGPLALAWLMNQHLPPPQVLGTLMIPMALCAVLIVWLARILRAAPVAAAVAAAFVAALLPFAGVRVADAAETAANAAGPPADVELASVDLRGRRTVLGTLPGSVFAPRVSPDGRQVVFELQDPAPAGGERAPTRLYVADLAHLEQRRALPMVGGGRNWAAVWTPDGQHLVFQASGEGPDALWMRAADGSGEPEKLLDARAPEGVYDGGRKLAFITLTGNRDYGISLLDLASHEVTQLVDRPGSEQHSSRLSPDGRWVAYASNETGRQEVWLEPLPTTGKRYRVTRSGGSHPLWAPDGRTLYFDSENQMYRLDIFTGAEAPKVGDPKPLPIRGFRQGDLRRQFDLTPDGKRFLLLYPVTRP